MPLALAAAEPALLLPSASLSDAALAALPSLTRLPFGEPQCRRGVVLLECEDRPARRLAAALSKAIQAQSMRKT